MSQRIQYWTVSHLSLNSYYHFTNVLQAFHDGLDFVSVHESLLQDLRSCLVAARSRQSLDAQLDAILKAKGGKLVGKTAFTHVIVTHLTTRLLLAESGQPDFQGSPPPAIARESALSGRHRRFAHVTGQLDVCRRLFDMSPFIEKCQGKDFITISPSYPFTFSK